MSTRSSSPRAAADATSPPVSPASRAIWPSTWPTTPAIALVNGLMICCRPGTGTRHPPRGRRVRRFPPRRGVETGAWIVARRPSGLDEALALVLARLDPEVQVEERVDLAQLVGVEVLDVGRGGELAQLLARHDVRLHARVLWIC